MSVLDYLSLFLVLNVSLAEGVGLYGKDLAISKFLFFVKHFRLFFIN